MKHQAEKKRSERSFEVGDLAYLKLQPYIQSSLAFRGNNKLSFRYYGPYKILHKVGQVSYKLDLPASAKIHPVVHVSQLKKHVPPQLIIDQDLSSVCTDPDQQLLPVKILDRRQWPVGSKLLSQVLVQWSSLPSALATWEETSDLRRRFPSAPAWGQAGN